ncbi:FGGY-family carbohydrate kinase [Pelagibacterium limicola]|uniref:FGGY-family carbohydrate kinase n=1 Tax=Pelagibacterium limicola TaxID=2791022 RepID=UPI0018AFA44D|nr:FGGY-family carbohydrate kinase [Pelagibacterium limicola]
MYVVAVDVGTSSARAGVSDMAGEMLSRAEQPIEIQRRGADFAEHQSEDIWQAVCKAVRAAVEMADVGPAQIVGLAFDGTCSLVVRGRAGQPLAVSPGCDAKWDTVVWLDHRAQEEAEEVNGTGHRVLAFSGGAISPEMEIPKLMWLKRNMPQTWEAAGHIFDLSDFLVWKATGSLARSQSTLTSKWTFLAHEKDGWQRDFLARVGLEDMVEKAGLPAYATPIGARVGPLTPDAAAALGLTTGCVVGMGMVDAHAGALGVLGAAAQDASNIHRHLGLIAGTSSAVTALSAEPRPAAGLWGPYYGAVLPGVWLNEGGQSASGAALDHIIRINAQGMIPGPETHARIIGRVMELRKQDGPDIAPRLHVLPDFHGNRSPFADPLALGVISGLSLDASFDGLCRLYWRTAVSIALGVRQILETLNRRGYAIDTLHVAGGHTRNPLLMELYADATGCVARELTGADAMLLGTAMVAATAAGLYAELPQACAAMQHTSTPRQPDLSRKAHYDRDYAVFLKLHAHRREIDAML